jgi:hypothetical protein
MESIRAANPAVKYSVVNQAKDWGDFKAIPVNKTVQSGKRVVATSATRTYASKIFFPRLFSPSSVAALFSPSSVAALFSPSSSASAAVLYRSIIVNKKK